MKKSILGAGLALVAFSACKKEEVETVNPFAVEYSAVTIDPESDYLNCIEINDANEIMVGNTLVKKLYHSVDMVQFDSILTDDRFLQLFVDSADNFCFTSYQGIYRKTAEDFEKIQYAENMYFVDGDRVMGITIGAQGSVYGLYNNSYNSNTNSFGLEELVFLGAPNVVPIFLRNDSLFFRSNGESYVHHRDMDEHVMLSSNDTLTMGTHVINASNELTIENGRATTRSFNDGLSEFRNWEFIDGDIMNNRVALITNNKLVMNWETNNARWNEAEIIDLPASDGNFVAVKLYNDNTALITTTSGKMLIIDIAY